MSEQDKKSLYDFIMEQKARSHGHRPVSWSRMNDSPITTTTSSTSYGEVYTTNTGTSSLTPPDPYTNPNKKMVTATAEQIAQFRSTIREVFPFFAAPFEAWKDKDGKWQVRKGGITMVSAKNYDEMVSQFRQEAIDTLKKVMVQKFVTDVMS